MVLIVFTRRRGYVSHLPPVCSHYCLLRKPGTRSCRLRADHVALSPLGYFFLFFLLDLYSFCTPRQPSYPVFDQISISAVSIRLCLSPARLQPHETFADWVVTPALSLRKLCRLFSVFSDSCTRSAGQPIARLETLLILWLILTSSPFGFSLQPGIFGQNDQRARLRGMQMTVSARNFPFFPRRIV